MLRRKYRIVEDRWAGFEVQAWSWWWPVWTMPECNTFRTVEKAEAWAVRHAKSGSAVKMLGWLPRKETPDAR